MTAEMRNDKDNRKDVSPDIGKATSGEAGKVGRHVLMGLLLFISLSLIIFSVNDESESIVQAPDSAVPESIALSEPAIAQPEPSDAPQEISPEALEDFRADPAVGLEVIPLPIEPLPLPEESDEVSGDDSSAPEEVVQAPELDEFSLGEALARYLLAMREELNREYVENCIEFRSRNGQSAGCPDDPALDIVTYQEEKELVDELFTIITRESDYARIASRLERENEALASILDDPANPSTAQASTRLALNNDYIAYLNGNPSPAVAMFEKMNDFINDYNRTILTGPSQFNCQGPGPCVYEFTEPDAE